MFNKKYKNKSHLLNSLRIVKAIVCLACIAITLTSCSQKNSIDSGSVETPSVEALNDENDKIEISMEDVIAIGKFAKRKFCTH